MSFEVIGRLLRVSARGLSHSGAFLNRGSCGVSELNHVRTMKRTEALPDEFSRGHNFSGGAANDLGDSFDAVEKVLAADFGRIPGVGHFSSSSIWASIRVAR